MKKTPKYKPPIKFDIEDAPLVGGKNNDLYIKIMASMKCMNLPSKEKAFFIPASEGISSRIITGVLTGKRELRKKYKKADNWKNCQFTCRTIRDANNKYIGVRVWRIN